MDLILAQTCVGEDCLGVLAQYGCRSPGCDMGIGKSHWNVYRAIATKLGMGNVRKQVQRLGLGIDCDLMQTQHRPPNDPPSVEAFSPLVA